MLALSLFILINLPSDNDDLGRALELVPQVIDLELTREMLSHFEEQGPNELQIQLRKWVEERRAEIISLKQKIEAENQGLPVKIQVPATDKELDAANLVLQESGFGFLQFEKLVGSQPPKTTAAFKNKHWIAAAIVFSSSVVGAAIYAQLRQSQLIGEAKNSPEFVSLMRPLISMGAVGALSTLQYYRFEAWWKKTFLNPWKEPFPFSWSFGAAIEGMKRVLWPKGFYARILGTSMISGLMLFSATQAAHIPPSNPVSFQAPSALVMAAQILSFSLVTAVSDHLLSRFQNQGSLSLAQKEKLNFREEMIAQVSRVFVMVPFIRFVGLGISAVQMSANTLSLWLKDAFIDRIYRQETARRLLKPEEKAAPCAGFFSRIALRWRLKRD